MEYIIISLELYLIVIFISLLVAFLIKGMLVLVRLFSPKPMVGVKEAGNKGK